MSVKILTTDDEGFERTISIWEKLSKNFKHPFALYSSPEWFKSLSANNPEKYFVGVIENKKGDVKNVLPFELSKKTIAVSISKTLMLSYEFNSSSLLCGEPIADSDPEEYNNIINEIFKCYPSINIVYFKCAKGENCFGQRISNLIDSKRILGYSDRTDEQVSSINLGPTFSSYLSDFTSKQRYNLKRQVKQASKATDGQLSLKVITDVEQLDFFFDACKTILDNSWKKKNKESRMFLSEVSRHKIISAAQNGFLRSYLLFGVSESPWAFVLGFQLNGSYHYSDIGYNIAYSEFSPGVVLFYKMLEDLFANNKPETLSFGVGDTSYKRRFGNDSTTASDYILFRKKFLNYTVVSILNHLNVVKQFIKRYIVREL